MLVIDIRWIRPSERKGGENRISLSPSLTQSYDGNFDASELSTQGDVDSFFESLKKTTPSDSSEGFSATLFSPSGRYRPMDPQSLMQRLYQSGSRTNLQHGHSPPNQPPPRRFSLLFRLWIRSPWETKAGKSGFGACLHHLINPHSPSWKTANGTFRVWERRGSFRFRMSRNVERK